MPTNGRRKNRTSSSSTLLKIDTEANNEEEEEEDDDEEDEEIDYEKQITLQQQENDCGLDADDDDHDEAEESLELHNLQATTQNSTQSALNELEKLKTFVRVPLKKTNRKNQPVTQST